MSNFINTAFNMAAGAFATAVTANSGTPANASGASGGMPTSGGGDSGAAQNDAPAFGVPGVMRFSDVADCLPPRARRRFISLCDEHDAALALANDTRDRLDSENVEAQRYRTRIRQLKSGEWGGGRQIGDHDPSIVDASAKAAKHEENVARLRDQANTHSARVGALGSLISSLKSYLRSGLGPITELPVLPKVALRKGETFADGVERCRRRVRELDADAHMIKSSPWPSDLARERARSEIAQLVSQCEPSVSALIETQNGGIGWPGSYSQTIWIGGRTVDAPSKDELWRCLPWLLKDQLIAGVERLIDDQADDKNALTDEQRTAKLATIAADKLAVEYEEVGYLDVLNSTTMSTLPRVDCDPRAFLLLSGDMPPPNHEVI